jgi:hypothetical protein
MEYSENIIYFPYILTYSKGENQFLMDMEGIDLVIVGFHELGTWDHGSSCICNVGLHVLEHGIPMYPDCGPQHSRDTFGYLRISIPSWPLADYSDLGFAMWWITWPG